MIVAELSVEDMVDSYHYPVMYREVLSLLETENKKSVVDCTAGVGSHAYKLLQNTPDETVLIGIDRDKESLAIARKRLKPFAGKFELAKGDFANLKGILEELNISSVDAFLFDLGVSTYQLNNPQRGFSFLKDGPLDMRMDRDSFLSAYDLVNSLSEAELANIFRKFGEERYAKRIAFSLTEARKMEPISTTTQLARIIIRSIPAKKHYYKIHPATRIFQSLRIAVNRELDTLETGLRAAVSFLEPGGRIAVISFHSLEDRIVKNIFRDYAREGVLKIITKKPLVPSVLEKEENISSRSAKLRVAEKI